MEEELKDIDIREVALKCRTKDEVYKKITVQGNYYLPNKSDINNNYIFDILQGRKRWVIHIDNCRCLQGNEIVYARIPQIRGLRVSDIIEFANKHVDISKYFPE